MADEPKTPSCDPTPHLRGGDDEDYLVTALTHLKRSLGRVSDASWKAHSSSQEACLREWAEGLGLLLDAEALSPMLRRGGMEHDVIATDDRYYKSTRHNIFGLTPGIELALVSSSEDARRFHLWQASPYQYLERLHLQNTNLVPGLNRLEGILAQGDTHLAIVTSQPRFQILQVTVAEIDAWFAGRGFGRITDSAYYRAEDNLGVFDAHEKNLVRAAPDSDTLIPFDVIPCHPEGGFLQFIRQTVDAGHSIKAIRSTSPGLAS